jgi:hypothetical protein
MEQHLLKEDFPVDQNCQAGARTRGTKPTIIIKLLLLTWILIPPQLSSKYEQPLKFIYS